MSGYKRVNFYELCRLCATNQQKEKTHIFTEEGRKIQLQNKIQSCLSLNVCETDFLPKVVCSKCLRSLEVCYTFRQECVTSETMLSSYFKNFRYTEDFKKSGKVYIKDTTTKQSPEPVSSSTNPNNITATMVNNAAFIPTIEAKQPIAAGQVSQVGQSVDHVPFYTLQLPTLVANPATTSSHLDKQIVKQQELSTGKIIQSAPQIYNLNTVNLAALKTAVQASPKVGVPAEGMSNVVVNANGEVINIAQLVDFESLINQAQLPKATKTKHHHHGGGKQRHKELKSNEVMGDESVVKIDLTAAENAYDTGQACTLKYDKLPHIKSTHHNDKYTYTVKVEEPKGANVNPTVIFNTMTNYHHQQQQQQQQAPHTTTTTTAYHHQGYGAAGVYQSTPVNIVTTTGGGGGGGGGALASPSICNAATIEPSTVSLNVLNQNMNEAYTRNVPINQSSYTNVISSISTTSQNVTSSSSNSSNNITTTNLATHNTTNNNNNNTTSSTPKFTISQNIPLNTVHITTANNNGNINNGSIMTNITNSTLTHQASGNRNTTTPSNSSSRNNSGNGGANAAQQQQKLHACEICQKQFKRKEHLYQHIKLHTGFRPYSCENCNKSFMRKEHLLRHMTSHSGQKNFTCSVCEKSFSRNDNLLKHKKTHDKQSSYACEVCNKQFVMKHYYLAHKMTHEEDPCKNVCVLKAECV